MSVNPFVNLSESQLKIVPYVNMRPKIPSVVLNQYRKKRGNQFQTLF